MHARMQKATETKALQSLDTDAEAHEAYVSIPFRQLSMVMWRDV
jgi:hypothetical protein